MSEPQAAAWPEAAGAAGEPPITGDPVVDAAIAGLAGVIGVPVAEQPAAYDAVHRALQDRLADDEG